MATEDGESGGGGSISALSEEAAEALARSFTPSWDVDEAHADTAVAPAPLAAPLSAPAAVTSAADVRTEPAASPLETAAAARMRTPDSDGPTAPAVPIVGSPTVVIGAPLAPLAPAAGWLVPPPTVHVEDSGAIRSAGVPPAPSQAPVSVRPAPQAAHFPSSPVAGGMQTRVMSNRPARALSPPRAPSSDPFARTRTTGPSMTDEVPKRSNKTLVFAAIGLGLAAVLVVVAKVALVEDEVPARRGPVTTGPAVQTAEIPAPAPHSPAVPAKATPEARPKATPVEAPQAPQRERAAEPRVAPHPPEPPRGATPRVVRPAAPAQQPAPAAPPPAAPPKSPPKPPNGGIVRDNPF